MTNKQKSILRPKIQFFNVCINNLVSFSNALLGKLMRFKPYISFPTFNILLDLIIRVLK